MNERHAQICRLIEIRHEHLPEPVHRLFGVSTGFVHQTRAPAVCPVCEGVDSFGCTGCGGRGETEVVRERDPYARDVVVPYGLTGDRHEARRERDSQIARLERQTRPASAVDEDADAKASPYAWERARKRLYASYHLAELDRAIEWFHGVLPGTSLHCGLALGYFDVVLPDPLRAPDAKPVLVNPAARGRAADSRALDQRDTAIRRAIAGGAPTAHVAASFSLSVSQINRIVGDAAA